MEGFHNKAKHTQEFATSIGLKQCFTAACSPASNGMAEALLASFKRDYVYVNDCETADWVLAQLPTWFRDYNEVAPHSALAIGARANSGEGANWPGDRQRKWGPEQAIGPSPTTVSDF